MSKGTILTAECDLYSLELQLLEDVECLDATFSARCMDTGEVLRINGWLWSFETVEG